MATCFYVLLDATKPSSSEKNSNTLLLPVTLGVAGGCAVLIVVVALFTIAVTCVSHRTVSKCSLHLETPVPLTITSDSQKSKKLSAPNEANVGPMEFLRENLDFHEQLGKSKRYRFILCRNRFCLPITTMGGKTIPYQRLEVRERDEREC